MLQCELKSFCEEEEELSKGLYKVWMTRTGGTVLVWRASQFHLARSACCLFRGVRFYQPKRIMEADDLRRVSSS